jgi:hypothetical protein
MAEDFPCRQPRKYQKNKAQNLVPEGMNGFHRSGYDMFYKLARLLREVLVAHVFMLSKCELVPAQCGLYNQGDIPNFAALVGRQVYRGGSAAWRDLRSGTDGPVVASQKCGYLRIAPDERGTTWKNVSRA